MSGLSNVPASTVDPDMAFKKFKKLLVPLEVRMQINMQTYDGKEGSDLDVNHTLTLPKIV
jgi:hypothetical protein